MVSPPSIKVLLIGWDAADWKLIDPLLKQGKMPNLQTLIDGGVRGNLTTLSPPLSPMLWTSIATGKRPFRHGILGFGTGSRYPWRYPPGFVTVTHHPRSVEYSPSQSAKVQRCWVVAQLSR